MSLIQTIRLIQHTFTPLKLNSISSLDIGLTNVLQSMPLSIILVFNLTCGDGRLLVTNRQPSDSHTINIRAFVYRELFGSHQCLIYYSHQWQLELPKLDITWHSTRQLIWMPPEWRWCPIRNIIIGGGGKDSLVFLLSRNLSRHPYHVVDLFFLWSRMSADISRDYSF